MKHYRLIEQLTLPCVQEELENQVKVSESTWTHGALPSSFPRSSTRARILHHALNEAHRSRAQRVVSYKFLWQRVNGSVPSAPRMRPPSPPAVPVGARACRSRSNAPVSDRARHSPLSVGEGLAWGFSGARHGRHLRIRSGQEAPPARAISIRGASGKNNSAERGLALPAAPAQLLFSQDQRPSRLQRSPLCLPSLRGTHPLLHPQHPGFDFSGADVTGNVPDPASFLGGIGRP